jgi:hypothetical protein
VIATADAPQARPEEPTGPVRLPDVAIAARDASKPAPAPAPAAEPAPAPGPVADAKTEAQPEVEAGAKADAKPEPEPTPETEPQPLPRAVIVLAKEAEAPARPEPKADASVEATTALVPDRVDDPQARPRPIDPEKPAAPPRPRDPWLEGLDRLRSVVRDRLDVPDGDADGRWTLRARLLECLDESSSQAEAIRGAFEALEAVTPLEITELQLCRKVKGFGDFEPLEAAACRPGRGVILYCEMAGVRYESEGALHRSRLASRVEIVATSGGAPVWTQSLGTADDLCRRRRHDYYVNYRMTLPDTLPPGSYEVRLVQDDLVANHSASRSIPVVIQP